MKFAAVGSDGMRLVVWGFGMTKDAASADARFWLDDPKEAYMLEIHAITPEQYAKIEAGDVSWPVK